MSDSMATHSQLERENISEMSEVFTCESCNRIFGKSRSDVDAEQELRDLWDNTTVEDCVVLCDDCFAEFMAKMESQQGKPN
jgi:hypothetical protein